MTTKMIQGVSILIEAGASPDVFSVACPSYGPSQAIGWVGRNQVGMPGWAWRPFNGNEVYPGVGPEREQGWHGPTLDQENAINLLVAFWMQHRVKSILAPQGLNANETPAFPLTVRDRTLLVYALGRLRRELAEDREAGRASPWPTTANVDELCARIQPK
jgi:hypothetical protein